MCDVKSKRISKLGNTDAIGIDGVDLRTGSVTKGTQLMLPVMSMSLVLSLRQTLLVTLLVLLV